MENVPPESSSSFSVPSLARLAKPAISDFDLGDGFLVGVADHGHDQAVRAADGDAHVHEVLVDDVVAVDLGVHGGEFLQRRDRRP